MIERRKGTLQHQRRNEQLIRQDFKIDDRSFEDLLGYLTSYLEHINYYNTENQIDGNWKALVETDPIIYMVTMIQEPINNLRVQENNTKTLQLIFKWYAKIQQWKSDLIDFNEERLANKIGNILTDVLDYQKRDASEYQKNMEEEHPEPESFSEAVAMYSKPPPPKKKHIDLAEIVETFKKTVYHIQNFTQNYLRKSVFKRDNHLPNNAMYITFIILYRKLQNHLNGLSKRHLDFYYKEILQQTVSKAIPTKTVVCFEIAPQASTILIPEGTKLSAGKLFGSKKEVLFGTDKTLLLDPIRIHSLETLFFNKSSFIKSGTDAPMISGVIKNQLIDQGKKNMVADSWALFGGDQDTLVNSKIASKTITNIGFMIGSPVLFLEEGHREITLTCTLEKNTAEAIFWKLLDQMVINEGLPIDIIFNRIFETAFTISYTTVKGWEQVSLYDASYERASNSFQLHFTLRNIAPSITALPSEKEHSIWPMIKVELDEYAPVYAYSFFKSVVLEDVRIEVEVQEIKNLSIYNNIGKMPLTKSFDLFGPLPSQGGYIMIGKSELFKKDLTQLDIHIDWETVPQDFGGFETYYQEYEEEFTNDSFEVKIQALSNGYWFPREGDVEQKEKLFTTEDCRTPEGYESTLLDSSRTFSLENLGPFEFSRDYRLQSPLKYTVHSQSGFIKLTFSSPNYAFGQELYQKNYTRIASYNAINQTMLPLPNKPFVPKVKAISLDYKAKDIIYFNNSFSDNDNAEAVAGDFLHITPFGVQKVVSDSKVYKNTLFADYKNEGYFYIGLTGLSRGESFSMFFDLQNQTSASVSEHNNILFQFEETGNWVTLAKKYIISDSTNQLTKSGIIELRIPEHLDIKKGQVFTIRCVARTKAYTYPKLNGIYTNAVTATCISKSLDIAGKQIPAFSIAKTTTKISSLKQVLQPAPSYGGKLPGTEDMLYSEVSERIRHKDRAVTIWDYERLTLQYFHEVIAVKCTNLDDNFRPKAGCVRLIVLSSKWQKENHHYFNGNELFQIAQLLQKKSNSFVKINVQNPELEWLLVNCSVSFYEDDNGGYYIHQLNETISDYLCPLPTQNSNIEGIGDAVEPRMLVSYIENLPYIQEVEYLNIEHIIKEDMNDFTLKVYEPGEIIRPTKPSSILAPVAKHHINSNADIEESDQEPSDREQLNLQVGIDYIIEGDNSEKKEISSENKPVEKIEVPKENMVKKPLEKDIDTVLTFKI